MSDQHWFRIVDKSQDVSYVQASGYGDAANQLYESRFKGGKYRDVPQYDHLLWCVEAGELPLPHEIHELVNQGNGLNMDRYVVVRDDEWIALQQKENQERMRRLAF